MKKTAAIYMASLMMITPVSWAWAQQNPGSTDNRTVENEDLQSSLADLQNPSTGPGKAAAALEKQLAENWAETSKSLFEKVKSKTKSSAQREINRYKLRATIGLKNQQILNTMFSAEANYQIVVEPNFRDGEQVRRDIYVFGLGGSKGLNTGANAGASAGGKIQVRVTFSRIFTGPNAKWDAIAQVPYFLNKLPGTSDAIKEKMKVGETIRLEVLGNLGAGISSAKSPSLGAASVGAGYGREGLFVADVYRHSPEQTRVRLFGLKNRGTFSFSAGATLSPWGGWLADGGGKIGDAIRDASNIGLSVGVSKSADLFHDFPIDTMMLDYLYTFKSAQTGVETPDSAEAAVSEVLKNIQKVGFIPLFNLFAADRDLAQILKQRSALSEKMAKEDYANPAKARVRHLFKGRITSNISTFTIGLSASRVLGSTKNTMTRMKSFVRSEDTLDRMSYYLLESASNANDARAFFDRNEEVSINDVDILMKSNDKQQVTGLLDIVTSTEIRDKKFKAREIETTKSSLLQTLPNSFQSPELVSFFPAVDQRNAYYRSKYSFGLQALVAMNKLDKGRISQALYEFLDKHPNKRMMNLPEDMPTNGGTVSFTDYVMSLGHLIYQAVGPEFTYEQRAQAFHVLIRDPVFQKYLIGEFFTSLLPEDEMHKLANVNLQFSSEETPTKELSLGEHKSSEVYRFVSFLRSVLNNRSYDLRLETQINESGHEVIVTPEIKGFKLTDTTEE